MTGKRFDWDVCDGDALFYENGAVIDYDDVVELLNELHEETQKCKEYNSKLYANHIETCRRLVKQISELEKENEQLKSTIKDVVELLSEEVDLFSDKALEHDICAYIELKELDNKDAYYMATSTKKAIKMLNEVKE